MLFTFNLKKNELLRSLIGSTLCIFILLILTETTGNLFIMAPFGATCVLLFAVHKSPLAKPRNIILGHFISALIGLLFLEFIPISSLTIALSVGIAIVCMQIFKCIHPPEGANPLVILLTANYVQYDWSFLIMPVLIGACSLVLISYLVNNFGIKTQ